MQDCTKLLCNFVTVQHACTWAAPEFVSNACAVSYSPLNFWGRLEKLSKTLLMAHVRSCVFVIGAFQQHVYLCCERLLIYLQQNVLTKSL